MKITELESRELIDACLEAEGVEDSGSIRRDKAAEHFARDLDAFEEIDARDDDRAYPWNYLTLTPALIVGAALFLGLVIAGVAVWMN